VATFIAVGTACILAFATGAGGKGALKLWPLFGAVNQTLAALALIVITLYLKSKGGRKWVVAGIPAVFMAIMTLWAAVMNQFKFGTQHNLLLQTINFAIIIIAAWIVVEGVVKFFSHDDMPLDDAEMVTSS
jgi:carbon starvation protein